VARSRGLEDQLATKTRPAEKASLVVLDRLTLFCGAQAIPGKSEILLGQPKRPASMALELVAVLRDVCEFGSAMDSKPPSIVGDRQRRPRRQNDAHVGK
jgi:hypothetical protein